MQYEQKWKDVGSCFAKVFSQKWNFVILELFKYSVMPFPFLCNQDQQYQISTIKCVPSKVFFVCLVFASVGRYLSLVFGLWRKVIFSSSTYMKFEEFGDVVKDGKEDDGKNVGPSGPGVRKLKKKSVLRNLQLYGWLKETYWGPLATDEMEPLLRAKKGTCDCWKWRKPSKGEMTLNKNYKNWEFCC